MDSLSTNELSAVAEITLASGKAAVSSTFPLVTLKEPPKASVYGLTSQAVVKREAFAVVYDPQANETFEAVVDLPARLLVSWKHVPGVEPMWTTPEDERAMQLIRSDTEWQAAMRRRGITNLAQVAISTWVRGQYPIPGPKNRRYYRATFNYQGTQTNLFGPPIEGLEVIVDMTAGKILQVVDTGLRPVPAESTDFFDPKVRGTDRPQLMPLTTIQTKGPSFEIVGQEIRWDRWKFRYGFDPREGLVLYLVRYNDDAGERMILYRASISEMLVPYGDPDRTWFWRSALDEGEYGLGKCSSPLVPGKNTPKQAHLLDVAIANETGKAETLPHRIDVYEREGDLLWSHYDYSSQVVEGRRSRELVIGFIATEGRYDYSFHWVFRQDASIEFVVELTGIILTKGTTARQCDICQKTRHAHGIFEPRGEERFGTLVAPQTLGVNHQHFINMRLDFDVDGVSNSVKEVNVRPLPRGKANPDGNAFTVNQTILGREREAVRDCDPEHARTWIVFNENSTTALGHFAGYSLEPGINARPFLPADSVVRKVTGFVEHPFFATRFHPAEINAAGPYPTFSRVRENVLKWSHDNEMILNQDIVVWYTFGLTHIPRPEDYPVMPVVRAGFKLLPKSFFNRNPALDVAPED